ncbi:MAG: hypothetical protein ACRC54_01960 [Fusobacteriaceae bacterium]
MKKNLKTYDSSEFTNQIFEEEDEIDLLQIFRDIKVAIIKNKKTVIGIFLVISILSIIVANRVAKKSRIISAIVQLDYDRASEGVNFDGTKFDKERLINDSVLRSLYKIYSLGDDFDHNIDNVKNAIFIEGLVPSDIKSISDTKLKAGERYIYTPIQYTISFKYGNIEKGKRFLEKLISESNEKYKQKYLPNQGIGKLTFNERQDKEYDYYDHIDIFNAKLDQIQSKIDFLREKNYQSKTSRGSYSDLQSDLDKLKNVEISNYYAEIQVKKISKNALITKMNYENKIRLAALERLKLKDRVAAISEVIKSYKPTEKQVIVTGITENIRLNNLDDYYSNLVNSYRDTVIEITEIDSKIREYQSNMGDLRVPSLEEARNLKENKTIIIESMNILIQNTEDMLSSYYEERYNKFIDVIVPVHVVSSGKGSVIVLLGIIFGIIMAVGTAYIKEFLNVTHKINKVKNLCKIA